METTKRLLLANQAWAEEKLHLTPGYFEHLASGQEPEFLWIGCSDSRVPAGEITGTGPGEIFVHRNVANLVVPNDFNLLAVLQYAVEFLKVNHIIVCGHYGCGGVTAALGDTSLGFIDPWIAPIKGTYKSHRDEIDMYKSQGARVDRLVELNVLEQVQNLARTSIVQDAWRKHQRPTLHGWVFSLASGHLEELVSLEPGAAIDPAYKFDLKD